MGSTGGLLYSCSSLEWQLGYIGEVHLNGFTGVCQAPGSPAAACGTRGPGQMPRLPSRRNLNTIARTENERSRAPLPGIPVRAQPDRAHLARSSPSREPMTPRRGPGQDPVRPAHSPPLTGTTREDADVMRPSFWARRLCECGHDRGAHRHYRHGSDCALCDCPRWSTHLIGQLARRLRR
jgi:hypothetical protein